MMLTSRYSQPIMSSSPVPTVSITDADRTPQSSTIPPTRPSPPSRQRSSSLLHKNIISRMRPLPFQYVFALWHTRASSNYALNELSDSVPDIAAFYRIFNNFPWDLVALRDSVHFFRSGVTPQWEDPQNLNGGCWTLKVRRDESRALQAWEELCLMVCGGELQAAIAQGELEHELKNVTETELVIEHDHVLGISYSPRQLWAHISIWTKDGSNANSVEILQKTILTRLSSELRPTSVAEYYYKKHSDHDGWKEIVAAEVKRD